MNKSIPQYPYAFHVITYSDLCRVRFLTPTSRRLRKEGLIIFDNFVCKTYINSVLSVRVQFFYHFNLIIIKIITFEQCIVHNDFVDMRSRCVAFFQ